VRLRDLAARLELPVEGDDGVELSGVAGLEDAVEGQLSFVTGPKFAAAFAESSASAFVVPPEFDTLGRPCLVSWMPYVHFARAVEIFHPRAVPPPGVHETAVVAEDVQLGEGVSIGAYAVIGAGSRLGNRTCVYPHATLYPGVETGQDCQIHSGVHLHEGVRLGNRVVIQSGAVIGSEGFGFAFTVEGRRVRIPHVCPVEIGDDCDVGANSTIDASHPAHARRGYAEVRTRIGNGVKIDNLVQVGHGAVIGDNVTLCALVGLAGSTEIEKNCYFAGASASGGHLKVGEGSDIGGMSGVTSSLEAGSKVMGVPAIDRRLFARITAASKRLPELLRRVRRIEKRLELEESE
jgi:UDP-3-O-[3-hydroxymyristoyl] glucosamine N-acyltransferase